MSFLKQLLSTFEKPQHPEEPFGRGQPDTNLLSDGQRRQRITLSQVRQALCDPDDSPFDNDPAVQTQTAHKTKAPEFDISQGACTTEEILSATRRFLDDEILAEERNIDVKPEFPFEKVLLHAKGSDLPRFSTAEELRTMRNNGSDLTIPVRSLGMSVDRNMLDRMQAGRGPRPFRPEDMVEKLRLEPKPLSDGDEAQQDDETYDELLAVLQAWNTHVTADSNLEMRREGLLDALKSHCHLTSQLEKGHGSKWHLDQQSSHLRQALQSYLPALKKFKEQDVFNQLIIVIANQGISLPTLDDDVRDGAIETLFRGFRTRIYLGEVHCARRYKLDAEMERAKLLGDDTKVHDLTMERRQLDKQSCNEASEQVRTAIKSARRSLRGKVLEELQTLTEQQAGQKWTACSLGKTSASTLAQSCIESGNAVDGAIENWVTEVDSTLESTMKDLRRMNCLGSDNSALLRKLAGLDVPRAEREAVMERRRNDPRTASIMTDIAGQNSQLHATAQRILERVDGLDESVRCVLDAARASFIAHDTLMTRIDGDDPFCVDERSLAAKPQIEAKGSREETARLSAGEGRASRRD